MAWNGTQGSSFSGIRKAPKKLDKKHCIIWKISHEGTKAQRKSRKKK